MRKKLITIRGNRLIIIVFLFIVGTLSTLAQTLKGKVVDSRTQEPIIGAVVSVKGDKGAKAGAVTDVDGNFSLQVNNFPTTLVASYTGYNKEEVDVYEVTDEVIKIDLTENFNALEGVVVIGYGTQKKSDLTGSVGSVDVKELNNISGSSFNGALGGSIAGLQATPTSGQPGGGVSIRIRGGSSVQGGNEPLYVIDGFPIYTDDISAGATAGSSTNPLASINPGDIESINVLKDASATAIYGSRGANGVIIITTKGGKYNQKTQVSYDGSYGWQTLRKKIDVLNAKEFASLRNDALYDSNPSGGRNQYLSQDEINALDNGTDWQDAAFRTAPTTNHQLSISGGSDKIRYAISGGYYDQNGIIINTDYRRFSGHVNLDAKISKKINVGVNIKGSRSDANVAPTDIVTSILLMPPTATIYEADGSYTLRNPFENVFSNPIASLKEQTNKERTYNLLGTAFGEWEIINGLKLKVLFGTDISNKKESRYVPSTIYEGATYNGIASIGEADVTSWLNENTLTYDFSINKKHHFNLLAGYTQQEKKYEIVRAGSSDFVTDDLKYNDLGSGSVTTTPYSYTTKNSLISYLGRVNYNYDDRYFLSASLRADGSSRFGADKKWGAFPSVGFSWNVTNERFFKRQKTLSELKLRLSYGVTGNQEIGNYQSLSTLSSTTYVFGDQTAIGFHPDRISNSDLGWESTKQFDAGLDFGFFHDRLSVSLDYYYKKTTDLLLDVEIPWTTGYDSSLQNYGSVSNQGLEFTLDSKNFVGKFNWNTSFNISFNRNKVLSLGNGAYSYITSLYYIVQVGKPLGSYYGAVTDGVLQTGEESTKGKFTGQSTPKPGDILYKDVNGDGSFVSSSDRTIIGDSQPDFTFGLTNSFNYANFDLSFLIQGVVGNDIINGNKSALELFSGQQNADGTARDRWTETNPSKNIPRAKLDPAPIFSDRFVEDGSFVRLKNLTFGYTLPKSWLRAIRIANLRLYFSATNLWTITNYSGFDPEVTSTDNTLTQGYDSGIYPVAKTYNFGVQVTF